MEHQRGRMLGGGHAAGLTSAVHTTGTATARFRFLEWRGTAATVQYGSSVRTAHRTG